MKLSNAPGKLLLPFANTGAKNSIPVASQIGITAGAASLTDGFPPLTRTPIAAGGVPPSGLDMNGILYALSAAVRWANAGGGYVYDSTFANDSNVNGYPKGARIMRSDGLGYWFNTVENNTTDPEAAGAAAAGWVPDFTNGVTSVAMASANVTLTPLQYGKPIIVITGTLTANLNLIFPTIVNEWMVINNTTGPFTVTCKTAAGTGLVVNTAALIVGDGTNIQTIDVAFKQNGAGAIQRTSQLKLRDIVSVKDFGAIGDSVTDDSTAFQAAADAANVVHVPWTAASYLLNSGISATGVRWVIEGKLTGPGGLPGLANYPSNQVFGDIAVPSGATQPQATFRSVVAAKGDNATFIGGAAGFFEARDRSDVTALNKGVLYGISVSVVPSQARNNVPYDDCDGITVMNTTGTAGAKATDAIYIAHNSGIFPSSSEWYSGVTIDANCDVGIQLGGRYANYGIDLKNANFPTGVAVRLGNTHAIHWRNNSNSADVPVLALDADNIICLGGTNVSGTSVKNWFGTTVPAVQAGATYSVGFNDNYLIFNGSGCTVTLPSAGSFPGRILTLRTTTAFTVVSASSNVVPLAGGSAGTAILAATIGKWAKLVSDGAVWQIMAGN